MADNAITAGSPKTYHCLCAQLLFVTTTALDALPKRQSDQSIICPLPKVPTQLSSAPSEQLHYAQLEPRVVTATSDPIVIKSSQGFEPRYPVRCPRCSTIFGYLLDQTQFSEEQGTQTEAVGRRDHIVYLLPDGLSPSESLA